MVMAKQARLGPKMRKKNKKEDYSMATNCILDVENTYRYHQYKGLDLQSFFLAWSSS